MTRSTHFMPFPPGTRLGPYEVMAPIGAGGMGEVYRARDTKLNRDVAIKVLPEAFARDPERVARFEREAQAIAALSHPNILDIHDFGAVGDTTYAVMELLDGETLRERLARGALPVRKATDYASQIARGLAAAHERNVVHRDLKPENLFITTEGRVKILDFGLARQMAGSASAAAASAATAVGGLTDAGTVLGTVGYMSPEQVRAGGVDHRSDIFSFGAVLYEMLTGRRAFGGDSAVETMNAILKEEPSDLTVSAADVPPALERVVTHCLEKQPSERFQSARDLAFALESAATASGIGGRSVAALPENARRPATWRRRAAVTAALVTLAFLAGAAIARWIVPTRGQAGTTDATFRRLTFDRGTIRAARFAADGKTVVYSAAWEGQPLRVLLTRAGGDASTVLDLPPGHLLSISRSDELAVSVGHTFDGWLGVGTLARSPMLGGAPRPTVEAVREADWTPDGATLAIVRRVAGRDRLEWPIGKVLYETNGYISTPRFSRDGGRLAFGDHPLFGDNDGNVAIVDGEGRKTILAERVAGIRGVDWSPAGDEVWFSASSTAADVDIIQAVDMSGRRRLVLPGAVDFALLDVSPDGRMLVSRETPIRHIEVLRPGDPVPRDYSLFENSVARALSPGGKVLLVSRQGPSSVYLRRTDEPAPFRLGDGEGWDLSPDGRWALATAFGSPSRILLLPTGAGESREVPNQAGLAIAAARWMPDGRHIALLAATPSERLRGYITDVESGATKPFTPPGVNLIRSRVIAVTPDSGHAVFSAPDGLVRMFPVNGGEPQPIRWLAEDEFPLTWLPDGRSLLVTRGSVPPWRIERIDLTTGRRTFWKEAAASQQAGARLSQVVVSPDGEALVHSYSRLLSTLYLVEGVR